jgi:hypothetical protein
MTRKNLFWVVMLVAAMAPTPIASAAIETVEMRVEGMT